VTPAPRPASDAPFRVALRLLRQDPRRLIIVLAMSLIAAASEGAVVAVLVPVLSALTQDSGAGSITVGPITLQGLSSTQTLGAACLVAVVLVAIRAVAGFTAASSAAEQRQRVIHRLRCDIFDQLTRVGISYFGTARAGALVSNLSFDLMRADYALGTITTGALSVMIAAGYTVALVVLAPWLSLVTLALLGAAAFGTAQFSRRLKSMSKESKESISNVTVHFTERLSAARLVRVSSMEAEERRRFARLSEVARRNRERELRRLALLAPATQFVLSALIFALIFIAYVLLVRGGALSAPALLAYFFALFRLAPLLQQIVNNYSLWIANRVGLVAVVAAADPSDKPLVPDGSLVTGPLRSGITFERVSFEYEPGRPVLDDVSFSLRPGQVVALVGSSGAGKSTAADLLARFYDPTSGSVRWDGVDLRDLSLASLRDRMGIVSQETFILHASVRENVCYGKEAVDDDDVWEALARAEADDYVRALPEGLDTILGEKGARLSGGQRQRIAIARAILRDPDVLILDEATSALDPDTERAVQRALAELMAGRTSLIITHRLLTIANADIIHVLHDGRIVESGTYETLLDTNGRLTRLHKSMYAENA
jgi:subfamily B ATP-binding cassette protein MsbA